MRLHPRDYRVLSYLPLSHIGALQYDISSQLVCGSEIYFAKPDALQGSLFDSLKWAWPTFFMAVPRVWEKIEIRTREILAGNDYTMKSMFGWAQKHGYEKVIGM